MHGSVFDILSCYVSIDVSYIDFLAGCSLLLLHYALLQYHSRVHFITRGEIGV
jgi:hypothetical protein